MDTSNHSSKAHRVYWLTRPGQRLAAYLDYCETKPTISADLAFADVPGAGVPEHHDEDREQPRPEPEPATQPPEDVDLEAAGYDGMGGTPWEGSEPEDDGGYDDSEDDEPEED